jgi:hypothetical protein
VGDHVTYLDIIDMWEAIVCPKDPLFEWHARDCMFSTCGNHGVDNLALCLNDKNNTSSAVLCWKCFSMENVLIKKGGEKKKLKLLHMQLILKVYQIFGAEIVLLCTTQLHCWVGRSTIKKMRSNFFK